MNQPKLVNLTITEAAAQNLMQLLDCYSLAVESRITVHLDFPIDGNAETTDEQLSELAQAFSMVVNEAIGNTSDPIVGDVSDLKIIDNFRIHIGEHCSAEDFEAQDHIVSITIGGKTLVAYDNAALINALDDALINFKEDLIVD